MNERAQKEPIMKNLQELCVQSWYLSKSFYEELRLEQREDLLWTQNQYSGPNNILAECINYILKLSVILHTQMNQKNVIWVKRVWWSSYKHLMSNFSVWAQFFILCVWSQTMHYRIKIVQFTFSSYGVTTSQSHMTREQETQTWANCSWPVLPVNSK